MTLIYHNFSHLFPICKISNQKLTIALCCCKWAFYFGNLCYKSASVCKYQPLSLHFHLCWGISQRDSQCQWFVCSTKSRISRNRRSQNKNSVQNHWFIVHLKFSRESLLIYYSSKALLKYYLILLNFSPICFKF